VTSGRAIARRALLRGAATTLPFAFAAAGCVSAPEQRAGGPVFSPFGAPAAGLVHDGGLQPRAEPTNWIRVPQSIDGFSRLDQILASHRVAAVAGAAPWRRPEREPALVYDGAAAAGGAGRFTLDGYLERNPATGLAIVKDETLLVERYRYGRDDRHRFTSFSMAKTVVALLIGIAVEEGRIGSIEDPAARYVPALGGSEYGRTPIRHLLTMSSGVAFREDYDGADDVSRLSRATIGRAGPGGAAAARLFDRRVAEPGARWSYASAETFVLALVLAGAVGEPVASYTAARLWGPIGAEADASWLVDASGNAVGYMGFNAVLRDYARLARMLAAGGRAGDRQVVPARWMAEATRAHFAPRQTGGFWGYGFQTWTFPAGDGSFALLGVRGQAIYVDPRVRVAMVHVAVRPDFRDPGGADTIALWRSVRTQL
jgi:CubicO group peptidase (beta-lactamase class C family)